MLVLLPSIHTLAARPLRRVRNRSMKGVSARSVASVRQYYSSRLTELLTSRFKTEGRPVSVRDRKGAAFERSYLLLNPSGVVAALHGQSLCFGFRFNLPAAP